MRKDTHIVYLHTIQEEINENTLLATSEEVIPDDADCEKTLPSYSLLTDPIDYNSFIELINLSESILTEKGKQKLLKKCWKHRTAFYEYDSKPGLYSGKQSLIIKLKTDKIPTRIKPSRMSIEKETEISKQIADMIKSGMIEPSRSPYLSRLVLVRKNNQKWRFVVDFRSINSLIEQQSHIITRIDKITEKAAGKNYYTSFNLKTGFHQTPLDENSRKIAAFITHKSIFQYKIMPVGLTGSPDKFQEIMDEILFKLLNCYVYLDDILTCTTNEDSHLSDIEAILERIAKFNMKINAAKYKYGIHPNTEKVKAINSKPIPRTQKEVKSFLGAASYFRRHIKNLLATADPFYKLDKKFVWEEMHTNAFNKLKDALSNAVTLSPPDNTKNYTIFYRCYRSLKPAEKNYPIIKLEALGLIYALKQFRPYIYGKHTIVITDHKPLLALLKNKELTGILQRYQMAIMEYDLTIQYIKGEANNVADYLSRETFMAIDVKKNLLEEVFPLNMFPPYKIDKFLEYYNEKEKSLISKNGKIRTASETRIYVSKLLREKLLTPKMDEQMTTIWTSCHECQLNKEQPSRLIEIHKKTLQYPNEVWCTLNADFMQYNDKHILVIIDEYSKFVVASVSKKQNAPTLLNTLIKCFSMIGFPKVLRSDNGPAFIAKSVAKYLKSMGIDHQLSAPYNHTNNAFAERFNNTLRAAIRVYKNKQMLSVIVAHFMYAYNRTKNLKTGSSPAQILLNSFDK
uniref:RNA-directed DNA polymerase n=1 Tax=Strongyloides venezuelensis TaxID=75913 RepID=A0A0K0FZC0_STRVS